MARVVDTARNSRLLLGGLVILHLVVIAHQVDAGGGQSLLQRTVFALLSPGQRLVSGLVSGVGDVWAGYVDLRHVGEENQRLKQRLETLQTDFQRRQQQAEEAGRLRELLGLRQILPLSTVTAEVVARDGLPWFRMLTLDKGLDSGVVLNAAVLSPSGVVGRVVAVGPGAAKVQLLLDRDSGAGVMIERTRVTGVVSGQVGSAESGTDELVMKYVPAVADAAEGDAVVTSGLDRIFPKGLMVGRVRSVGSRSGLFKEVLVTPSARFDQLEQVLVIRGGPDATLMTEAVRPEAVK